MLSSLDSDLWLLLEAGYWAKWTFGLNCHSHPWMRRSTLMNKCGLWPSGIQQNLSEIKFFSPRKGQANHKIYEHRDREFCLNRLWFWSPKLSTDFFFFLSRFCSFHFSFVPFCRSKNLQQLCLKYNCEPFCVFFQSWWVEH